MLPGVIRCRPGAALSASGMLFRLCSTSPSGSPIRKMHGLLQTHRRSWEPRKAGFEKTGMIKLYAVCGEEVQHHDAQLPSNICVQPSLFRLEQTPRFFKCSERFFVNHREREQKGCTSRIAEPASRVITSTSRDPYTCKQGTWQSATCGTGTEVA